MFVFNIEIFTSLRKENKDSLVNCFVEHDSNRCNIGQWCLYVHVDENFQRTEGKLYSSIKTNICENDMETLICIYR